MCLVYSHTPWIDSGFRGAYGLDRFNFEPIQGPIHYSCFQEIKICVWAKSHADRTKPIRGLTVRFTAKPRFQNVNQCLNRCRK